MDPHLNAQQDRQVAPLPVGTLAPDFTLPQTPSARVALHSLLGQPVVLVFYPLDWNPVSRDQLVLYQKFAHEFEQLGARLLGISVDSVYCHAAFAREAQLRFPLLADFQPRGEVARRYGVYRDGQGACTRALVVLDRQGTVRFSHAYPDFFNPGVDDVLTTLEALAAEDAEETKRPNEGSHGEDTEYAGATDGTPLRRPSACNCLPPDAPQASGTPEGGTGTK